MFLARYPLRTRWQVSGNENLKETIPSQKWPIRAKLLLLCLCCHRRFKQSPQRIVRVKTGLALYLTNWSRRLWTCQEGVLAQKILLRFSDKDISNDNIDYPAVDVSITRGRCVTFPKNAGHATMSEFVVLRDFLRDGLFAKMGPIDAVMGPLAPLISVIQTCSMSWRIDEIICFGSLTGLNVRRLQDSDQVMRDEYRQKNPPPTDDKRVILKSSCMRWASH